MATLIEATSSIQEFERGSLTSRLSEIETILQGCDKKACESAFSTLAVNSSLLDAAFILKRAAGQVNVLIHAVGILLSLPYTLHDGELVEALSLGAGNTGRPFDLETNRRVAEFKFINWKGGSESIRQNSLFKDFYLLAEHETSKERYLYVMGTGHPLKFLKGGRSLESVMSRNNRLLADFRRRYGNRFSKVREYYAHRESRVQLADIAKIVPQFAGGLDLESAEQDE